MWYTKYSQRDKKQTNKQSNLSKQNFKKSQNLT